MLSQIVPPFAPLATVLLQFSHQHSLATTELRKFCCWSMNCDCALMKHDASGLESDGEKFFSASYIFSSKKVAC